jgi:23S rRNA pseudouridine2605 synthase
MTERGSRHGLARVLSKRGLLSRSEAARWIVAGRVRIDGRLIRDPEHPTAADAHIEMDGAAAQRATPIYLALNKPRGLITTAEDERGRPTIYDCLRPLNLPWVAPVGRLDQASEGLLLLSNDPEWAARITSPDSRLDKTYHVQVAPVPSGDQLTLLAEGVVVDSGGPRWRARSARLLRSGGKTAWLEIVLDEGRNRQIRRMLEALDIRVLRLIRVAIGSLVLGSLAKGAVRRLSPEEVALLVPLDPERK